MKADEIYDRVLEEYALIIDAQEAINDLIKDYDERPEEEKDDQMTESIHGYYEIP